MKALVVDDDALNRELASRMLASMGWAVAEARDGPSGVEAARAGDYGLILIDLRMPGLDGRATAAAIREALPDGGGALIIAASGSDEAEELAAAPFDAALSKPFVKSELAAAIDAARAKRGGA